MTTWPSFALVQNYSTWDYFLFHRLFIYLCIGDRYFMYAVLVTFYWFNCLLFFQMFTPIACVFVSQHICFLESNSIILLTHLTEKVFNTITTLFLIYTWPFCTIMSMLLVLSHPYVAFPVKLECHYFRI